MDFENLVNFDSISLLLTVFITLLSAYLGFKASGLSDQNCTAKLMVEKIYFPVFSLIEKDLFQQITLKKAVDYGVKITDLISQNPMYIYPSLKLYAERLSNSSEDDFQENFKVLCWSVNKYYDKYSKKIGLPLRSYTYRINTGQYENRHQLFFYYALLKLPNLLLDIAFIIVFYFTVRKT